MNRQSIEVSTLAAASLVIEHTVAAGDGLAFRWWHSKLTRRAKRFKGYIRTDLCPPVKGSGPDQPLKWYSIVHFNSTEHLNQWVNSRDRKAIIQSGQKIFSSYQFISFATGLEGWFSKRTGTEQVGFGPPAWKQNATVMGVTGVPRPSVKGLKYCQLEVVEHQAGNRTRVGI